MTIAIVADCNEEQILVLEAVRFIGWLGLMDRLVSVQEGRRKALECGRFTQVCRYFSSTTSAIQQHNAMYLVYLLNGYYHTILCMHDSCVTNRIHLKPLMQTVLLDVAAENQASA